MANLFIDNNADVFKSNEYKYISKKYSGLKTERSQVPLINHINEGIYILDKIKASTSAKLAYCMHPIFQNDQDLLENYKKYYDIKSEILILTMEYRKTANAYLSKRQISSLDDIELSILKDVNDMLIADKIQNRKDFELYHKGTHPRSFELDVYFKNWLSKLEISENFYTTIKNELINQNL